MTSHDKQVYENHQKYMLIQSTEVIKKTKICTLCKLEKNIENYHKNSGGKFGVLSRCKDCIVKIMKKHYENNAEKIREKSKAYRVNNPKKIKELREKGKEKQKQYRLKNKEKLREINKLWKQKNRDRIKALNKKYVENLTDWVVARSIIRNSNLKKEEIPIELIEIKRLSIKIYREKLNFIKNNNIYPCSICNEYMAAEFFYKNSRNKRGLSSICKKCVSITRKKRREL